jgi:hypothetical protein
MAALPRLVGGTSYKPGGSRADLYGFFNVKAVHRSPRSGRATNHRRRSAPPPHAIGYSGSSSDLRGHPQRAVRR